MALLHVDCYRVLFEVEKPFQKPQRKSMEVFFKPLETTICLSHCKHFYLLADMDALHIHPLLQLLTQARLDRKLVRGHNHTYTCVYNHDPQ